MHRLKPRRPRITPLSKARSIRRRETFGQMLKRILLRDKWIWFFVVLGIVCSVFGSIRYGQVKNDEVQSLTIHAVTSQDQAYKYAKEKQSLANTVESLTKTENPPTQGEIESYVRTIFGNDAHVAIAVSKNECSPSNKSYPGCVYVTDQEFSCGLFQINLKNSTHMIHASKVPGETVEAKCEWLKNPKHNTLVAYKIFSDSGWNPWTGYTSGNYLKDM